MIKVLHILNGLSKGGGMEQFVMNSFRSIDRTKVQFDFLFTSNENAFAEEIEELGGKVFYHNTDRKIIKTCKAFKSELRRLAKDYDVVHIHAMSPKMVVPAYFAKKYGVKNVIVHSHGCGHHDLFNQWLKRKLVKNATSLVACSTEAADQLYGKSAAEAIILRNGVDTEKFRYSEDTRMRLRTSLALDEDTVAVCCVARMAVQKNQKFLIDSFAESVKLRKSKLYFFGYGSLENELKKYCAEKLPSESYSFEGLKENICEYFSAMDLFALPSLFEGLVISAIEAQASGITCLLSDQISEEVKFSDVTTFLPIDQGCAVWTEKLAETTINRDRVRYCDTAKQAGFDAKDTTAGLYDLYC